METTKTEDTKSLIDHALKHGCILGVIGILITLLIYVFNVSWFASFWLLLVIIVLNLGYTIYAGIEVRKNSGGYLTFQKAFLHGLIIMTIAMIIGRLFTLILFNIIDPQLAQTVTDITVEKWTEMMAKWGMAESAIDEAVNKMKTDMPKGFTPSGLLISIFWPGLVVTAVVACITGLIVKKKEPEIL
jgi:hypothetical protein